MSPTRIPDPLQSANMAPLRIACFHSFRMSSGCLRKQMSEFSNFAASLGEQVEFRYLDAPHRCPPEKEAQMPERLKTLLPPPYFEWWNARESDDGAVSYDGEAATLAHVTDFMQREGSSSPPCAPPHLCTSAPLYDRPVRRRAWLQSGRQPGAPAVHGARARQGPPAWSKRCLGRAAACCLGHLGRGALGLGCSL